MLPNSSAFPFFALLRIRLWDAWLHIASIVSFHSSFLSCEKDRWFSKKISTIHAVDFLEGTPKKVRSRLWINGCLPDIRLRSNAFCDLKRNVRATFQVFGNSQKNEREREREKENMSDKFFSLVISRASLHIHWFLPRTCCVCCNSNLDWLPFFGQQTWPSSESLLQAPEHP